MAETETAAKSPAPDPIARYRQRGGKLAQVTGNYPFVLWRPGDQWVTLDGDFSPAELRAFADHIEATPRPRQADGAAPQETPRKKRAAA